MKLSEFLNDNPNSEKEIKNKNYSQEELKKMIDDYSGLSEDSLMKEFLKLTMEKKRRGDLTDNELDNLKSTIKPMLNSDQYQKLNQLLEMVKNV